MSGFCFLDRYIGSSCFGSSDCCHCANNIPDSECDSVTSTCQCISGYYVNATNPFDCIIRKMGDACGYAADCFDAIVDTTCSGGFCACAWGFYLNVAGDGCIKRKCHSFKYVLTILH